MVGAMITGVFLEWLLKLLSVKFGYVPIYIGYSAIVLELLKCGKL